MGQCLFLLAGVLGSLLVAVSLGGWAAERTVDRLHQLAPMPVDRDPKRKKFTRLHGQIERIWIALLAIANLGLAVAFTTAWMGLKLASNWNRPGGPGDNPPPDATELMARHARNRQARGALSALAGSLVSAGIAIAAGQLIVLMGNIIGCSVLSI